MHINHIPRVTYIGNKYYFVMFLYAMIVSTLKMLASITLSTYKQDFMFWVRIYFSYDIYRSDSLWDLFIINNMLYPQLFAPSLLVPFWMCFELF